MTAYKGNDTIRLNSESADRSLTGVAAAWVNYNGIGTIAIRDDANVSSITDNGAGDHTTNFTNNMADASYSAIGIASAGSAQPTSSTQSGFTLPHQAVPTVSAIRSSTFVTTDATSYDSWQTCIQIDGSLA